MSDNAHDAHTGPIKTPAQLMWTSFFFFVVPIFIIIGLVVFVTSGPKPGMGAVHWAACREVNGKDNGMVDVVDAGKSAKK